MLARMDAIRARALLARAPGLSAEHLRALMLAAGGEPARAAQPHAAREVQLPPAARDRKSTRLNSSHDQISYAVFCLKKKKTIHAITTLHLLDCNYRCLLNYKHAQSIMSSRNLCLHYTVRSIYRVINTHSPDTYTQDLI